jgi:hypothetical protein
MITLILVIPSLLICELLSSDSSEYEDYCLLEYDPLPHFDQVVKMDNGKQQGKTTFCIQCSVTSQFGRSKFVRNRLALSTLYSTLMREAAVPSVKLEVTYQLSRINFQKPVTFIIQITN